MFLILTQSYEFLSFELVISQLLVARVKLWNWVTMKTRFVPIPKYSFFSIAMTAIASSLTLQEFLTLPNLEESPAWELIGGRVTQKPMPTSHHSILQKRLVGAIDQADSDYEAFPELRCVLQQQSVVPDVTVIRRDRLPVQNAPVQGAPDWMIEILSIDQSTTKLIAKLQSCLIEGTQLGWLIDPEEQIILVFWQDLHLELLRGTAVLPVLPEIPLTLTAQQVFDWLKRS